MEYRTGSVKGLKLVLNIQRLENILGEADGQMGTVGIIRCGAGLGGGQDIGESFPVMLRQAV